MSRHVIRNQIDAAIAQLQSDAARSVMTLRLDAEAERAADAADSRRRVRCHAPLLGLPVTVKDNFDLQGHATTAGSRLLVDAAPAKHDAVVVERLRAAGCILLGRTNMTEFAFSGLGLNPHYGTPENPAYPGEGRIPGGSSSGAAVSVALGITPVAIGTDTGGSVRIPAALCGLTGFKPTASAISRDGLLPLSTTLDSVGVIANTVAECRTLFDVLRDHPGTPKAIRPNRIRLGVVTNYVRDGIDPALAGIFDRSLELLERAGVSIEPLEIEAFDRLPSMMADATFPAVEAAYWHRAFLAARREAEYDPFVLARIDAGTRMPAWAYAGLVEARRNFIAEIAAKTIGLSALVWPTVPQFAPSIASLSDGETYRSINALMLRNSTIANLLDACAISIPCPDTPRPVGLTIAAAGGADDFLLAVADVCQRILTKKEI